MSAPHPRRASRARRAVAIAVVAAVVTVTAPPASGGLLGGAVGGLLRPVLGVVDPVLDPVTGAVSQALRIPLDQTLDDLLDGTVDSLIGTVDRLVLPDGGAPLAPPDLDDLARLSLLEPVDPVIEDVLVPRVLDPSGMLLGPIARLVPGLGPLDPAGPVDTAIGLARQALEPLDLDPAAYVVRATYRSPGGELVEVTRDGLVDVPVLVDVDGNDVPDLSVELRVVTARPSIRVLRLPTAPASLPVSVEAVIAPAGWSSPERVSVGFDALDSDLPGAARATIVDDGSTSGDLEVELHTTSPGDELGLLAGLYDQGPDGTRVDPTDVRIGFSPVPVDATLAATGVTDGFDSGRVAITTSEPSRVEAAVLVDGPGDATTEVAAIIDRVPGHIDLGLERDGAAGVALDYMASGPVDRIALRLAETVAGITRSATVGFEGIEATEASFTASADDLSFTASAPIEAITLEVIDPTGLIDRATTLRARLAGLPADLTIDLGDGTGSSIGLDAGTGVLGLLELQLTSGPDLSLDPAVDGVLLDDLADRFVTFVRLTGLRSVTLDTAGGLDADLRTLGGRPFVATVAQEGPAGVDSLAARLSALPAEVAVSVTEAAGATTLDYAASDTVDLLEVGVAQAGGPSADLVVEQLPTALTVALDGDAIDWDAAAAVPLVLAEVRDPGGLAGRATEVRARLVDVPTSFSVGMTGGGIRVDARPGAIGLVEVLATDGDTGATIPDGLDGLVLVDRPEGFAAAARITGLGLAELVPDPLALELITGGGRIFEIAVDQAAADGSGTDLRATIDSLPSSVRLAIDDVAGDPRLSYEGASTIDLLLVSIAQHRAGGGTTSIGLEVHDLPTSLAITLGEGAITYLASAPVPLVRAEVVDPDGLAGRATRLLVELVDLPTELTLGISEAGALSFDAGTGVVGSLEALLTSGPELSLPPGTDGLLLIDDPDGFMASLRIVGLRAITFDPAEAASFSLRTLGGRLFEIDLRQEDATGARTLVRATLDRLPAEVSVALGGDPGAGLSLDYTASAVMERLQADLLQETPGEPPTSAVIEVDDLPTALSLEVGEEGAISYSASARVPRLAVELDAPGGLFDRATSLRLLALDLPTGIDAALSPDGGLSAQTTGGALGLLEALITSGPEIGLDSGVDGIVLRDDSAGFAVFVRITGLTGIAFDTLDGGAELSLQTDGARVLEVDVATENPDEGTETAIRATLDRLPASVALQLTEGEDGSRALTYAASAPMDRLFADLLLGGPDGTSTFALEVLDLPTAVDLALDAGGAIAYTASDRTGRLAVTGENPDGIFLRATRLQAVLEDLPPTLSVLLGDDGGLRLDAGPSVLGHLDVLATSGPEEGPAPGVVGAVIRDTAEDFVLALRFEDARRLAVNPDPVSLEIATAGGHTFVVQALLDGGELLDLGDGAISIEATIEVLPTDVTLGFGLDDGRQALAIDASSPIDLVTFQLAQTADGATSPLTAAVLIEDVPTSLSLLVDITGAITYAASAPVPLLAVDAVDPDGLFDRATDLGLRLEGLPLGLDLALSESGAVQIDTTGGKLGLMEFQATTGPDNRLPAQFDGILYEDYTSRFVVFARFTNLHSGDVAQVPLPKVNLVTDGGRPLRLGLYETEPGKPSPSVSPGGVVMPPSTVYTEATLTNLPTTVDLELLPGAPGTLNINYSASSTADSLSLATNAGDRWITQATLSNPVPRSFTACQAGDRSCIGAGTANSGSMAIIANQTTTINVFDCTRPLNTNCRIGGSPSEYVHVNNLRTRVFRFTAHVVQDNSGFFCLNAVSGNTFIDTAGGVATGNIRYAGSQDVLFNLNSGFSATNRNTNFTRVPVPVIGGSCTNSSSSSGSITCGNFDFNVRIQILFTFDINMKKLFGC